jgi:hypothetical protein
MFTIHFNRASVKQFCVLQLVIATAVVIITVIYNGNNTSAILLHQLSNYPQTAEPCPSQRSCQSLFQGRGSITSNYTLWKPDECNTKLYTKEQLLICLNTGKNKEKRDINNYFLFLGDSTLRYKATTFLHDTNLTNATFGHGASAITEFSYKTPALRVDFTFIAYLSASATLMGYSGSPTWVFFEIGRWYILNSEWKRGERTVPFRNRLLLLEQQLNQWIHITDNFLQQSPKSKARIAKIYYQMP